MTQKTLLLIFSILNLYSCSNNSADNSTDTYGEIKESVVVGFDNFLDAIPTIDLPLTIKCGFDKTFNKKNFKDKYDSFIPKGFEAVGKTKADKEFQPIMFGLVECIIFTECSGQKKYNDADDEESETQVSELVFNPILSIFNKEVLKENNVTSISAYNLEDDSLSMILSCDSNGYFENIKVFRSGGVIYYDIDLEFNRVVKEVVYRKSLTITYTYKYELDSLQREVERLDFDTYTYNYELDSLQRELVGYGSDAEPEYFRSFLKYYDDKGRLVLEHYQGEERYNNKYEYNIDLNRVKKFSCNSAIEEYVYQYTFNESEQLVEIFSRSLFPTGRSSIIDIEYNKLGLPEREYGSLRKMYGVLMGNVYYEYEFK